MPAVERLEPKLLLSAITLGDDSFQMQASPTEVQSFELDLLGNDFSPAGGLVIMSVQSTSAGSVLFTPGEPLGGGSVSFELDPEFVGEDSFAYTVGDADGDQATGTVWLTVTAGDSGDGGPLTLAEQLQQLTLQAAKAQADLAAGQAKFDGAISGAQSKLTQQQAADEKKHADALAAAQRKLDEKVNAGHDKVIDALKAADTAYQQALTERLDAAATAIASGQETLVSKSTAADQLYQSQHQAAVDAATTALDSAAATLVAARDAAQAAATDQMNAAETGWNTAVTDASTAFETTYQATEAALTAAADQAVTLFGTATDGVASSFSTALTTAVSQRDALLAGLSGTAYVTTFSDPVFTAAMAAADTALNDAITAARANLQSQSTTALNGYNTATGAAASDLITAEENATTALGADLHNADVDEQTAVHNAPADYDTNAALAETAYDHSVHGAHDDLVAAVTKDEAALETSVDLAESDFETAAKEALAKYTKWVAEAFGTPVNSASTTTGTTTTAMTTATTTTGSAMPGAMAGSSMSGSTGGTMGGSSTGSTAGTLGTFQIAVKADAQTAYDALQLAANIERDACIAADTAYVTAITADQTAYLAVYGGLQSSLQTAVNTANSQVSSARDAALATYHQHQQQIASAYNSATTTPMTMDDYMAQSAARQAAEAGAKREFLSTVASAELTAAQTVGHQYVSAVRSERGARATLMVALRHDENVWTETKAAAETALKNKTDITLGLFMDDVTTLEGSYDTAAEQKFTTFESKVALAEQAAIVADQTAEAAFENALVADQELEVHADAAAEAAFEHALADDAQSAEKAIALADQSWFNAAGDAEALWLHAETDVSAAYVAALDAAAQGLDTELSADETAQVVAINAALTAWQTEVDNAWSAAFLDANGSTADSTAAADVFLGFGDSVTSSVAGVLTGFNAAYHALTSALVADVAAADQTEAAAAQVQTTTIANATKNALHQIGQSLKDEETAEADAEHAATTTVSDAIQGFITGETDAADAQSHTMINAVTGYTNGLVTTAFGALIGDWSDQATRFGAVTGASVGFATSTIDASGGYETATHDADLAALIATHRREEAQLKSILKSATSLATAGAAARVADILTILHDDLQRLLALDNNQLGQFNPDQMTSVLAARMMIPTDFTSQTNAENLTPPPNATPDQLTATESACTLINQAANTAQALRQSGVQTAPMQMMLGNATSYEETAWQSIDNEGTQLIQFMGNQFAKMQAKDQAAVAAQAPNPTVVNGLAALPGGMTIVTGPDGTQQTFQPNANPRLVQQFIAGHPGWIVMVVDANGQLVTPDGQPVAPNPDPPPTTPPPSVPVTPPSNGVLNYLGNAMGTTFVGNWSGAKTNLLGVVGSVTFGLTGLDVYKDVGDISHDLYNWEWKWSHAGNLLVDAIGVVPVIGAAKNLKNAPELFKTTSNAIEATTDAGKATAKNAAEQVVENLPAANDVLKVLNSTCFAAGTPVLTPDGERVIESLRPGDIVWARSEHDVTAPLVPRRVEQVFERSAPLVELHVGQQIVQTTGEHPFYRDGDGWCRAQHLQPGDLLVGHDDRRTVVRQIVATEVTRAVYNLRVAEDHTYFVGRAAWGFSLWVHNTYTYVKNADGTFEVFDGAGKLVKKVDSEDLAKSIVDAGNAAKALSGPVTFGKNFDTKVRKHIDQVRNRGPIKDPIPSPGKGGIERIEQIIRDRVAQGGGRATSYADEAAVAFEDGGVTYIFRPNGEFWTILGN